LSSDPNRQRPRSSKKQRAVQRDPAARDPGRAGGDARRVTGASTPTRPVGAGRTRAGSTSRSAGGIPTAWLAGIAIVAILAVAGFASGAIKLGGGGAPTSTDLYYGASGAPGGSGQPVTNASQGAGVGASSGTAGGPIAGCPTTQPAAAPTGTTSVVTIETSLGAIEVTLQADLSPIAVGNFLALARCGYYDGVVFHRVVPGFVIQGGDGQYGRVETYASGRAGTGGPGYEIQDEPVKTPYARGTVAMARTSQPNSVGSQFFIVLDNGAQSSLASANTYQIIGTTTKGMEVVDAIAAAADAENPSEPVAMTDVSVAP
jgi:cyclophilin family peptidyl-prolyl cis-trans isomerase